MDGLSVFQIPTALFQNTIPIPLEIKCQEKSGLRTRNNCALIVKSLILKIQWFD